MSFRSNVVSIKCRFDRVSFRLSVVSIKCRSVKCHSISFCLVNCRSINCQVTSVWIVSAPFFCTNYSSGYIWRACKFDVSYDRQIWTALSNVNSYSISSIYFDFLETVKTSLSLIIRLARFPKSVGISFSSQYI